LHHTANHQRKNWQNKCKFRSGNPAPVGTKSANFTPQRRPTLCHIAPNWQVMKSHAPYSKGVNSLFTGHCATSLNLGAKLSPQLVEPASSSAQLAVAGANASFRQLPAKPHDACMKRRHGSAL
jgi:hypothetical protein